MRTPNTQVVTALLLTILAGAHRALSYVLLHGCTGLALAAMWRLRWPWAASIPAASLVRSLGLLCAISCDSPVCMILQCAYYPLRLDHRVS
jgi:hypothetical protein